MKRITKYFIFLMTCVFGQVVGENKEPLRIAIVGCHDPKYDWIGIYSHLSKASYAEKNGYDACLFTEFLDQRMGYWYKIIATKKVLDQYDWVFYLDSDAIVMNDSIKLEDLIDDNYDIVACNDGGPVPILSGQFLIKNSKWSHQFLQDWWDVGDENNIQPGFDGGALIQLFNNRPEIRNHIKLIPHYKLGSYDWDYKDGDFVIQFAGQLHTIKQQKIKMYYELSKSK